jgi:hypothetical protein
VYPYRTDLQPESIYQKKCDDALAAGQDAINNQANWGKYIEKVKLIQSSALNPNGKFYITGYAQFFAPHPNRATHVTTHISSPITSSEF